MKNLLVGLIKFYQKFLYPALKPIFPSSCRFKPTCSEFTILSIKNYGIMKGCYLGLRQILRCNSWFK